MHRRLVTAAAWTLATLGAVTLSWFGVHTVLSNTAYPQRTLPLSESGESSGEGDGAGSKLPADKSRAPADDDDRGSSPRDTPSGTPEKRKPSPSPSSSSPSDGGSTSNAGSSSKKPGGSSSTVKTYSVSGGRASFAMYSDHAELVSATPNSGWAMQTWKSEEWIRVDFSKGDKRNMIFCRWDESGAPVVETDENAS
ncbi:hypothetical protein G5C51_41350 [Streptomyces sp. A7024]|uniref:Secreted protein n=1 Tax=Streptomyces coryli TaxID=1128680 RepID=A0A6G4UEX5_9ACTN|nr:hypothetical protein [Streptomyces coryli]NGN70318.1 hypothetical protein [Streptomyces coryli]